MSANANKPTSGSLMAQMAMENVHGARDLLDELDPDELKKLFGLVGLRVAERYGNPYQQGSVNATAFSALFGIGVRHKVPRHKNLDPNEAESWDVDDVRDFLFRN